LALIGFLVVAVVHFGHEDTDPDLALGSDGRYERIGLAIETLARGGFLIGAVLIFHSAQAATLFGYLIPSQADTLAESVPAIRPLIVLLVLPTFLIVLVHHLKGWFRAEAGHGLIALELISLAALFAVASPLVAFVTYFCLWHSFRHSLEVAADLDPAGPPQAARAFVRQAWPMTLGAIGLGFIGYSFLTPIQAAPDAIVRVVFIGLSALTVPHIVFTVWAEKLRSGEISWLQVPSRPRQYRPTRSDEPWRPERPTAVLFSIRPSTRLDKR
jgi:Brp/Blh family beta-carotene 15,15'-monooxygenase